MQGGPFRLFASKPCAEGWLHIVSSMSIDCRSLCFSLRIGSSLKPFSQSEVSYMCSSSLSFSLFLSDIISSGAYPKIVSLVSFTLHRSPFTRKQLYRRLQPAYTSGVRRLVSGITMARAGCAPDDQSATSITSLPQRSCPPQPILLR